jgi:hypothetical protein
VDCFRPLPFAQDRPEVSEILRRQIIGAGFLTKRLEHYLANRSVLVQRPLTHRTRVNLSLAIAHKVVADVGDGNDILTL